MVISGIGFVAVTVTEGGVAVKVGSSLVTLRITRFLVTCPPSVSGISARTLKLYLPTPAVGAPVI